MTILIAIATILLLKLVNAGQMDPLQWQYTCFWQCWQQAAAEVGCDPCDKTCTCNGTPNWTNSPFWTADWACLMASPSPCPGSTARTAFNYVCQPGNSLLCPFSSSSSSESGLLSTVPPTNLPSTVPPTDAPTTVPPTDAPTTVPPTDAPTTTSTSDAVVPTAARRRMGLDLLARACAPGMTACKVNRGTVKNPFQLPMAGNAYVAYSCIDTQNDLESCGGCPGEDGVDCSAIRGAVSAACVRGQCVVKKCERRYRLRHGECL